MRVDRRGVLLVLVALAAVAAVGLAAGGDRDGGDPALTLAEGTGRAALDLAVVLLAVLAVAVLALVVLGLAGGGPPRASRPKRSPIVTIVAIVAILLLATQLQRPDGEPGQADPAAEEDAPAAEGDQAAGGRRSPVGTLAVAGLGMLVLVAATTLALRARLQRDGAVVVPWDDEPVPVPAGPAPATLAERAAAEPDPRQAVLLAFAAAEGSLAATPLARRPATSPREWLAAVRRGDPAVADALAVVVGRYEVARFSDHAVGEADRRAALDALGRLP